MACRLGLISVKESALFLCDMQEKFAKTIQYFPEIVSVSNRLLKTSRLLDVPVVVTEQYPKGLGKTVPELGISEYPDIKPIEKTQFSMLTSDVLDIMKNQYPTRKSVILCGIEAHVCVQGTCLQLLDRGYDVHIVVDAVSSRSQMDRMFAFDRMKTAGAFLTTSESIILGLLGGSDHVKFREVQKLIMTPAPDSGLLNILSR